MSAPKAGAPLTGRTGSRAACQRLTRANYTAISHFLIPKGDRVSLSHTANTFLLFGYNGFIEALISLYHLGERGEDND